MSLWVAFCDGSAVPNPGRMGVGAVWVEPDGARHTLSQAMHENGCNNEAELRALLATLAELKRRGAKNLIVHCDNSIVVEQLSNPAAKPIARLSALFQEARNLLHSFDQASLVWIPSHRNSEADSLARAALGITENRVVHAANKRR